MALLLAGAEAITVDNQAHVQELSSLIQQAVSETDSQTDKKYNDAAA